MRLKILDTELLRLVYAGPQGSFDLVLVGLLEVSVSCI